MNGILSKTLLNPKLYNLLRFLGIKFNERSSGITVLLSALTAEHFYLLSSSNIHKDCYKNWHYFYRLFIRFLYFQFHI